MHVSTWNARSKYSVVGIHFVVSRYEYNIIYVINVILVHAQNSLN